MLPYQLFGNPDMRGPFLPIGMALCLATTLGAVEQDLPVIELFTSEGCSSCPPADALLHRLGGDGRIICLAFQVDYWNYLGWHDPWSSALASARQQDYARQLGGGVYTPCAVVNGRAAVLGSDQDAIAAALAAPRIPMLPLTLIATWGPHAVDLTAQLVKAPAQTQILFALVENGLHSMVAAGENRGSRLSHDHVVRAFTCVGLDAGSARAHLTIPQDLMVGNSQLIAFASTAADGIIRATTLDPPAPK